MGKKEDTWVMSYDKGIEFIEDRNGVSWYEAPRPRRFHRCRVQTQAYLDLTHIERCRCGGMRVSKPGKRTTRKTWISKNMRRRVGF